jgi:hypothetical protein
MKEMLDGVYLEYVKLKEASGVKEELKEEQK